MAPVKSTASMLLVVVPALLAAFAAGSWLFHSWLLYYLLLAPMLVYLPAAARRTGRLTLGALSAVFVGYVAAGLYGFHQA